MQLDFDEFMEAVRAYVREDGELGVMVDSRGETAEQLIALTGGQIVELMEPHDFAAIISGCTRAGEAAGADEVRLEGRMLLSCRKGSGMAGLLAKVAAAPGGRDYLGKIHGYLKWALSSPDIAGYMYGSRARSN